MLLVIIICMCPALLRNEYHFKNKQIKGTEIVADCILSFKLDYMWYIYVYHSNYEYAVYMY